MLPQNCLVAIGVFVFRCVPLRLYALFIEKQENFMYRNILFYSFLILIIAIVLNYSVARKFEKIAFKKGYREDIHAFAMCFWLTLIGYLYVIALPDLNLRKEIEKLQPMKIDELKKHKDALDLGVITQEEFEAKKKELFDTENDDN